jgi:hypothetical protein
MWSFVSIGVVIERKVFVTISSVWIVNICGWVNLLNFGPVSVEKKEGGCE